MTRTMKRVKWIHLVLIEVRRECSRGGTVSLIISVVAREI